MGYKVDIASFNHIIDKFSDRYLFYAPKNFVGKGAFSDTDSVRYDKIKNLEEIEFNKKSNFSFKEVLLPITQTLFYFTEDKVIEPNFEKKGAVIFLRSCDLHSVKRLDEIYLNNKFSDYYYKKFRENVKFILIGCKSSFENCFCTTMGTNTCDFYDAYLDLKDEKALIDSKWDELTLYLEEGKYENIEVEKSFVDSNYVKVNIPENIDMSIFNSKMWDEYDGRCQACGRCNFVCPTCTCFTMQDIFYKDNGKAGERRRVWASCHVDGYTDIAGGHVYRQKNGQRMRFKVLHKVYDFKKRFGYHMCVGCGRCDDMCPEYISYSNCINKLNEGVSKL